VKPSGTDALYFVSKGDGSHQFSRPSTSTIVPWPNTSCTNEHPRFITLEGIDGAGKSSHIEFLRERVRVLGADPVVTREPGGTPAGEQLRNVVLQASWARRRRRW
jgi:hypothetical protein